MRKQLFTEDGAITSFSGYPRTVIGTQKRDDAWYARCKAANEKRKVTQCYVKMGASRTYTMAEIAQFRALWREYGGYHDRSAGGTIAGISFLVFGRFLGFSDTTARDLVLRRKQYRHV